MTSLDNNNNNNNNTSICKAHNVSIRAESEAPDNNADTGVSPFWILLKPRTMECSDTGSPKTICNFVWPISNPSEYSMPHRISFA